MLGLSGPQVTSVERITTYKRKIEAAGAGRFWSKSFELDPWSSTRELLGWRDELIEAGWRSGLGRERMRLADIAAVEEAGPVLPAGAPDRLRAVIKALGEKPTLPLQSIRLVDERKLFPGGWRAMLDALEGCGVGVTQLPAPAPPSLDDGRLTLLVADTELVAVEALAAWLAAEGGDNQGLVFILGKDTTLLDHALAKAGLPRLGYSPPSSCRSLLQILPLTFGLAWEPPDPGRLLDFLLLPVSPLPRPVAKRLADVVVASPGIGGEDWIAEWAGIESSEAAAEWATPAKIAARLSEWREFVEPERHDPEKGMPRSSAQKIAEKVFSWAAKRAASSSDPLFEVLAQTAKDLATAIEGIATERLDQLLIERMLEQAIGAGVADPLAVEEAAPWRSVHHPGAIWGAAKTILWWHFADSGEAGSSTVWNMVEREALAKAGCPLDAPERASQLLAAAWERPLAHGQKIVLVRPALAAGAETSAHPLWHSLVARSPSLEKKIAVRAEAVLSNSVAAIAGRRLVRAAVALAAAPKPRAEWKAPKNAISARSQESATSLGQMLSCPLQWTLKYAGKLYPGGRPSLPETENLVGTLSHRIAQTLLRPGAPPSPDAAEADAAALFDVLLPQVAATLLLPGAAGELADARAAIPPAIAELARFLRSEKLGIVDVEHEFSSAGTLAAHTGVNGRIDLLAKTAQGRRVVVDLKWQRSESWRRAELENGLALQLAVYARHVSDKKVDAATGYFMLRQRRFLTAAPLRSAGVATVIDGPTPKKTWDRIAASYRLAMADLTSGKVRAPFDQRDTSLADFSDPILLTRPNCKYCDYKNICGVPS